MNWLLIHSGPGDAAHNMAMDEVLLEAMPRWQTPVLRFYGWTQPAATFGYFQRYAEVAQTTSLRPLIRRPTGGGIVPHDADWTYSAAFPPGSEWHSLKAEESYRRIHDWLRLAFAMMQVETKLAPHCKKSLPGQCFAGHEKYDLLWQGKKIAGAAQRRNKLGLLIQGSVQPPLPSLARAGWEHAMQTVATRDFQVTWSSFSLAEELHQLTGQLVLQKYGRVDYNQRR
jgi:lipoate-protein ligase A